jgi:uncharacterized protein (DUF2062 family)
MAKPGQKRPKKWLPTREEMENNRFLRPIAHRFMRSELWRFTRRSVPRGVALGIFAGFIIPVGQIFLAAFLAFPARANVPVAAATTFITNPLTLPFWLVTANQLGQFLLRIDSMTFGEPIQTGINNDFGDWLIWLGREAGAAAFGFVVLAIVGAAIGYLLSSWFWTIWIGRKRARQLARRR